MYQDTLGGSSLPSEELNVLEQAGQGIGVRTIMLTARPQLNAVTEYVTRGNEAQLNDPAFRKELVSWIRFNPAEALRAGDGLSGRAGGQPPLPTWLAKLMIGLVLTPKTQSDTDAKNIRSSAAVAVLVAKHDEKAAWVEVGRAYERLAFQATALDIRSAFINQPIEVPPLRPQFESWLGLSDEHALLLFVPFDSVLYAVDILGYSFMSVATLFAAPVFTRAGLQRVVRLVLTANGLLLPFIAAGRRAE